MEDFSENVLKTVCCTCLSVDRKLLQLCRIPNGVNNLYYILSYDAEAYREGFFKGAANLYVCWECIALMKKFIKFREQACTAQKQLSSLDVESNAYSRWKTLSGLSKYHKNEFDNSFTSRHIISDFDHDNFVDCGPDIDIKTESDTDDMPLSKLYLKEIEDDNQPEEEYVFSKSNNKAISIKKESNNLVPKQYFSTTEITETQLIEYNEKKRVDESFITALWKCFHCIEVFMNDIALKKHNIKFHSAKQKHTKCEICQRYIRNLLITAHRNEHYKLHMCIYCDYTSSTVPKIIKHLQKNHIIGEEMSRELKKMLRKTSVVKKPGSKPRRNPALLDKRTPFGFSCTECDKYFDNKNKRYKHIQRAHREGFRCASCDKRFAFRSTLTRHEQLHSGPLPREQCPTCGKMVRSDLARTHARTHAARDAFACEACDKCFVSRASYEHHLKYTQPHATHDILKHKCAQCSKGYRSRAELRDHVNYQHMGRTRHKCPICEKALATRRCVTRHVRRAHHGVKESARDNICQTCGKAFRDKKGLREHESIHAGTRPLSCAECGRAFRQSASLYTHRRRVHNMAARAPVAHTDETAPATHTQETGPITQAQKTASITHTHMQETAPITHTQAQETAPITHTQAAAK